jgi:hypothetical protein
MRAIAIALAVFVLCLLTVAPARAQFRDEMPDEQMSVIVGPSPWGWNLVGIKVDVMRKPDLTVFATGGLGTILLGGGAAWHPNGRNADGPILSAVIGLVGAHLGASYQWMLNPTDSIHFGLHVGRGWMFDEPLMPILAWERRL